MLQAELIEITQAGSYIPHVGAVASGHQSSYSNHVGVNLTTRVSVKDGTVFQPKGWMSAVVRRVGNLGFRV